MAETAFKSQTAMAEVDAYNWPPQNRADLMSLSVLDQKKDAVHTRTAVYRPKQRETSQNLNTADVQGAQPRVWAKKEVNRPNYALDNIDIAGSGPRQLHFGLNKVEYNLKNDDIEGSKPQCVKFKSIREPSNPLNPTYKLASFQYVPPPPLKFIRDSIQIGDIAGSKTKQRKETAERQVMNVKDIEGASPKRRYTRKELYDGLVYKDVYAKDWQSKRCTNPLQPEYQVRDNIINGDFLKQSETQVNLKYGRVEGSTPQVLPEPISGVRNLETQDIAGAKADTKLLGAFTHYKRREQVRQLTLNDDIEGSKPGTTKVSIVTDRHTNPLNPVYQVPGNSELNNNGNEPFGKAGCSVTTKSQLQIQRPLTEMYATDSQAVPFSAQKKPQTAAKPPSSASSKKSNASRLSTAQKLDKFIQ